MNHSILDSLSEVKLTQILDSVFDEARPSPLNAASTRDGSDNQEYMHSEDV